MSPSWWQEPYRGGGPAKVLGFPRKLYPPSAVRHGKTPSSKGPDVVAYKRTVSRLARWDPWQEFDDVYSDAFALGDPSSRVERSGVAGVQRQQDIDDTGWIGPSTFSALRYALVPEHRPHGGEQAMDAVAIDLINEAWTMFQGSEPAPEGDTLRELALERAIEELGYTEYPPGTNESVYGNWYGMAGPWCAMFVTWCYELEGDSPAFVKGSRYAYCPYIVDDAQERRHGLSVTQDPLPGDLVLYDWDGGDYDHVGLFERWVDLTHFDAIEGNTSTGSNSNGGEVMRRRRSTSGQRTLFVRVEEP